MLEPRGRFATGLAPRRSDLDRWTPRRRWTRGPRPIERVRERVSAADLAAVARVRRGAHRLRPDPAARGQLRRLGRGRDDPGPPRDPPPDRLPAVHAVGNAVQPDPDRDRWRIAPTCSRPWPPPAAVGGHGPDRRPPRRPPGDRLRGRARPRLHRDALAGSDLLRDERPPPVHRGAAPPPGAGVARRTARPRPPARRAARRAVRRRTMAWRSRSSRSSCCSCSPTPAARSRRTPMLLVKAGAGVRARAPPRTSTCHCARSPDRPRSTARSSPSKGCSRTSAARSSAATCTSPSIDSVQAAWVGDAPGRRTTSLASSNAGLRRPRRRSGSPSSCCATGGSAAAGAARRRQRLLLCELPGRPVALPADQLADPRHRAGVRAARRSSRSWSARVGRAAGRGRLRDARHAAGPARLELGGPRPVGQPRRRAVHGRGVRRAARRTPCC